MNSAVAIAVKLIFAISLVQEVRIVIVMIGIVKQEHELLPVVPLYL